MPRSSHSAWSYFSCRPTGSPHLVAEVRGVLVIGAAEVTEDVARVEGVSDDHVAAVGAGRAQVIETLEVAALALPVADGEIDEFQLRDVAEVGDGEDEVNTDWRPLSSRSWGSLSIWRKRS